MADPVKPAGSASPAASPPSGAQEPLELNPETLSDPEKFKDPKFRFAHRKMIGVIDSVSRFVNGDASVTEAQLGTEIKAWGESEAFKSEEDKKVLGGVLSSLGAVKDPAVKERANKVLAMLPGGDAVLKADAAKAAGVGKGSGEAVPADAGEDSSFKLRTITLGIHAGDESFRSWPHYYTLKVLPVDGFGQNQSSTFAASGGAEFGNPEWNFFAEGYYDRGIKARGNPAANFDRGGAQVGMVEYGGFGFGHRGPGGGLHGTLFGRQKVGLGFGGAWCTSVDGSEISGAKCSDSSFQLSVINYGDFLSFGYGPFEAGVRLLPSTLYMHSDKLGLPGLNRLPIDFGAYWYLTPPPGSIVDKSPEGVFKKRYTDAETTMTGLSLVTSSLQNNYSRKTEAAYQEARILTIADPFGPAKTDGQLALLNVGTVAGGVITGVREGGLAYRLGDNLRLGNGGQRLALGLVMGVEFLYNFIGILATPGVPDSVQTFPGQAVDPAKVSGDNEGITNLQAGAYRLNMPAILTRDGLAMAEATGILGNKEEAIKAGNPLFQHFTIAHAAAAIGGLVMVLTSGDGSGDGFFGGSIAGNTAPKEKNFEVKGSSYDFGSQRFQYWRLETGVTAATLGITGLVDMAVKRYTYNDRIVHPHGDDGKATVPKKTAIIEDAQIGLHTDGRTQVGIGVSGKW